MGAILEKPVRGSVKTQIDANALQKHQRNAHRRQFESIKRDISQLRYQHDVLRDALSEIAQLEGISSGIAIQAKHIAAKALKEIEIAERD